MSLVTHVILSKAEICIPIPHPAAEDEDTGSVNNCMCCKVFRSEHIHIQDDVRAWHSSLIAALLKLIQNIQTCKHYSDRVRDEVRDSSVLSPAAPLWRAVEQGSDVDYCLEKVNLCSASLTALCLPSLRSRCFRPDGIQ